jgi:hypothetical protein
VTPDPGGWNATWDGQHRQVTLIHLPWTPATRYTVTLSQARDLAGNDLIAGPVRMLRLLGRLAHNRI